MKALDFHNSFTLIKQILDEEEFNLSFSNRSSELQFSTFRSEDFRFQRNYGYCCHRSRQFGADCQTGAYCQCYEGDLSSEEAFQDNVERQQEVFDTANEKDIPETQADLHSLRKLTFRNPQQQIRSWLCLPPSIRSQNYRNSSRTVFKLLEMHM